jgi:hypothetical protein
MEIRTQFCLRCPLRAFGLPLSAEGFCKGVLSHWKGFPLLLREDVCDACRVGEPALPLMSRRTLFFGRSAGDPLSETVVEHRDALLRGVCTFLTHPSSLWKEPIDDTLRMLTRSAVATRGIDSRLWWSLSSEETRLIADN